MTRRRPSAATSLSALALAAALAFGASPPAPLRAAHGSPSVPVRTSSATLAFSFNATPYAIRVLDPAQWPYATTTVVPLVDASTHDEFGVRMINIGGVLYNHPVAQAQYAIALMYSYLNSGDPAYLSRAELQAQRLIETAVPSRNAIYFPYPFNFSLHGLPGDTRIAPWYSAMAQGQALTVFVRLFELTANETYQAAAVSTFNSFLNYRSATEPWTVFVDSGGYLWLEEYPAAVPDRTYNGHTFALFGLWDYHRLTGDADALLLMRGALTTAARYFPNIRVPNWINRYCLTHGTLSIFYHRVVLNQQLKLYTLTGNVAFARNADQLLSDYPDPSISGTVRFAPGVHTGYKFNGSGVVVAAKTAALTRWSSAPFAARKRIINRAIYYQITAGIWAGYWIPEVATKSYAPGFLPNPADYVPARIVTFAAGPHTGYTFTPSGVVTTSKTATFSRPSNAATDQRVVINGVTHLRIINGIWAGMYVPLSSKIFY